MSPARKKLESRYLVSSKGRCRAATFSIHFAPHFARDSERSRPLPALNLVDSYRRLFGKNVPRGGGRLCR